MGDNGSDLQADSLSSNQQPQAMKSNKLINNKLCMCYIACLLYSLWAFHYTHTHM